jgi:pimeloyl-ACP methyl ester carboxylesterase
MFRGASFEKSPQQVQEMYCECAKRGDAQIRHLIAKFNALHENFDDMKFTAGDLSTITALTLVVHGDRDRFFPVEIPVSIYRSMPDAALWIVPGGDHVPIYDSTVPFTSTALRFLDGEDSK